MCFRSQMLLAGTWKPVKQVQPFSPGATLSLTPSLAPPLGASPSPVFFLLSPAVYSKTCLRSELLTPPCRIPKWQCSAIRRMCTHRSALLGRGISASGATYEAWEGASKGCRFMASTAVTRQRHLLCAGYSLPSDLRVSTTGRKVLESTNPVNTDYTRLRLEGEVQNVVERH